uniref:Uncharacterized protein n=1 Tax=Caenorhabditis japonica TaxID=281687 RepID=A0A8R1I7T0_CAEJA
RIRENMYFYLSFSFCNSIDTIVKDPFGEKVKDWEVVH